MKIVNEIWNYLISTGYLGAIIAFAWMYIRPVLQEKQKHAKTLQERERLAFLNQLADMAVSSLVSDKATGHEKFNQAIKIVNSTLDANGITVPDPMVSHAVQAAYEKSNLMFNKATVKDEGPQLGLVVNGQPATDPVLKAVETAPNRANDVEGE